MSERFQFLCIKYLDGSLSNQEVAELTLLVKENKVYQKEFAEMMVQNAAIRNVLGSQNEMENEVKAEGKLRQFKSRQKYKSTRFQTKQAKPSSWPIFILAAMVFIGVAIPMLVFKKALDESKNNQQSIVVANPIYVKEVIGDVFYIHNQVKQKLTSDSRLAFGDSIESSAHSFAQFETTKKSLIVLNENSKFDWNEKNIDLKTGGIYAEINKADIPSVYYFVAPDKNQIKITGTKFEWSFYSKINNAVLKVKEGVVEFKKDSETKEITINQMINSVDFAKGLVSIDPNDIAPWLRYINQYKDKNILLVDNFKSFEYSKDWSIKTTQKDYLIGPKYGLFCKGKDQKIELSSQSFKLENYEPFTVCFAAKNIRSFNSFDYGYEVWSDDNLIITQGFSITRIDSDHYKLKEISKDKNDEGKVLTKAKKLPDIAFTFSLTKSDKNNEEKSFYINNNQLPNIEKGANPNNVRIVFFLKTFSDDALVLWHFKGIAIGKDQKLTEKAFKEIIDNDETPTNEKSGLDNLNIKADKEVLLIDDFTDKDFSSKWTIASTKKNHNSSPAKGLVCSGKNQQTELSTPFFSLDANMKKINIMLESESIEFEGALEYGVEIWNEKTKVANFGYKIDTVDQSFYQLKKITNDKENSDWIKKSKLEKAPAFGFTMSLDQSDLEEKEDEIIDTKISPSSNVNLNHNLQKLKLVFFVKTKTQNSEGQWRLKKVAIEIDRKSASK